jgi:hypothetical protein
LGCWKDVVENKGGSDVEGPMRAMTLLPFFGGFLLLFYDDDAI